MSRYHHISIEEREKLLILLHEEKSLRAIAKELERSVSTVSREIKRNSVTREKYSAVAAQKKYKKRRKKCRRPKLLENELVKEKVKELFLEFQWSPEEISNRLAYEESLYQLSYNTIYRAIYAGMLDSPDLPQTQRGVVRKLRHRGKPRRKKGRVDNRGQMAISHRIQERPEEAQARKVIGHWEADTLLGRHNGSCLVTLTDRCSRFLLAGKLEKKRSDLLSEKVIMLFADIDKKHIRSITPDRGKEFIQHERMTEALDGVKFYFADPHSPWQRGTNENTNGLLREYFPKSFDFDQYSDEMIKLLIDRLNLRPRKCLGWKSPFEVFFNKVLHLT